MRGAVLALALAACSLNREVATQRETERARTTEGTQEQHSASTTVVGPSETIAIEADFAPSDAGTADVDVPIPLADGGVRVVAVRAPPGRALTHFRAAVTSQAPTVTGSTTDSKGTQQTASTGKVEEKGDSKLGANVGFSLVTKLWMLLGLGAVLVGGVLLLRRVPTAALGAVPVAGPALAFIGGLVKPKPKE